MKSFREFLTEISSGIAMLPVNPEAGDAANKPTEVKTKPKKKEENANEMTDDRSKQLNAVALGREMFDGSNAGFETTYGIGNVAYSTPPNKSRIRSEKLYNSDIGLAFDTDEQGEVVGNQAGFEAVRRRQKQGVEFPTAWPQSRMSWNNVHQEFWDRLLGRK